MRSEKQRDEVFEHLKPYLEDDETTEDLRGICIKCDCGGFSDINENCRGCCVMELWLSNEYGEWVSKGGD